jgi:hypothetical protein
MVLRVQWYRQHANDCARRGEQSRDPHVKAAYKEMVRAWIILAESVEQLAHDKLRSDLAA